MCFSATASFGAGILLSAIGIATIKKVQPTEQKMFAMIPLIFAVQQISEGFLWMGLTDPVNSSMQNYASYIFLFFAQVLWPTWVPYSIMLMEKDPQRKVYFKILTTIGILVSFYLGYCLLNYSVEAKIDGYHISYGQNYPEEISRLGGMLYVIATIAPSFFSSIKKMWILGLAILLSYIITTILYTDYIVSVWCFFASIVSIIIYFILVKFNKPILNKH